MDRAKRLMPQRIGFTHALRRTWFWALLVGAYSSLALLKGIAPFKLFPDFPVALDAAVGFAMGLLIALRVNRAYERWWEARTHWGTLVNVSRNLAVKAKRLVPSPDGRAWPYRGIATTSETVLLSDGYKILEWNPDTQTTVRVSVRKVA